MPSFHTLSRIISLLLCLAASHPTLATITALDAEQLTRSAAQARLDNWQQLIRHAAALSTHEKLRAVNQLINTSVAYRSDQQIWGQEEYWATPQETLSRGQGDCEDLAIAKYFTLLNMGIANSQLRLTQVKALQAKSAHMVLAYYSSPQAQPLILDNLTSQILPASQRHDLLTVYAFNAEGVYLSNNPSAKASQPVSLLSRWTALSARMRKQDSSALRL
jgi:predicted transglutaminase-like cysteine proteinase